MIINKKDSIKFNLLDFIPALSGLIGKIALVSSFAYMWAIQLDISYPGFVFENVRLEIIIGGAITLIMALISHNTSPPGTLAPLVVLIPSMVSFGVHPLILSIQIGIFGIIFVKTKLFHKILDLAGNISKTSLALVFGISGTIFSLEKIADFFGSKLLPLIILILVLAIAFIVLHINKKSWLIIVAATVFSFVIPYIFGFRVIETIEYAAINFSPSYWWNDVWGIGFGLDFLTIIRTIPFALFAILLWAMDTVSVLAMIDESKGEEDKHNDIDIDKSFDVVSVRNLIGGVCGGSQTSSLWRSFLIPLYMVKRPLRFAAILLGTLCIIAGVTSEPIKYLSFPPLIWTILLFGIFLPFVITGIKSARKLQKPTDMIFIVAFTIVGVAISPIITWVCSIITEKAGT